jgi:hypothetical protein
MKRFSLFIITYIFITNVLFGQRFITGTVIDATNLKPFDGVNIYIENSTIGTITNEDGKFVLNFSKSFSNGESKDSLVVSFLGYKTAKLSLDNDKIDFSIKLIPHEIALDEVFLSKSHKLLGSEIVWKAFENYTTNFPNKPYISNGFLRHIERNREAYKWLIESSVTLHDNSLYNENSNIKIHINETRKSIDNRSVDSLYLYLSYLIDSKRAVYNILNKRKRMKIADTVSKKELLKGIKYNDRKINGLDKVFNEYKDVSYAISSKNKNIIRNFNSIESIFDKDILEKHTFSLDTTYHIDSRMVYKIKITPNKEMIELNSTLKKHYAPVGWIYIYEDNFAIKELDYSIIAASKDAKLRNKMLFGTNVMSSINLKYFEYNGKMYLKYFSCTIPKMVNVSFKPDSSGKYDKDSIRSKTDQYYYTKQEILFSELIIDSERINSLYNNLNWDDDLFKERPYNDGFWNNFNILLESKEDLKMRLDLEKKMSLIKQFEQE